jgi:Na+/glutamate symporter
MAENTKKKVKKVLPALVLATTFYYYSFLVTIGLVLGYLGSKIYCKIMGIDEHNGNDKKVFVDCGKWKIHFHHWILGVLVLLIVWIVDYFYLPRFFVGVVCGIIVHDIYDYNDWHKIFVRNESCQSCEKA